MFCSELLRSTKRKRPFPPRGIVQALRLPGLGRADSLRLHAPACRPCFATGTTRSGMRAVPSARGSLLPGLGHVAARRTRTTLTPKPHRRRRRSTSGHGTRAITPPRRADGRRRRTMAWTMACADAPAVTRAFPYLFFHRVFGGRRPTTSRQLDARIAQPALFRQLADARNRELDQQAKAAAGGLRNGRSTLASIVHPNG